MSWPKELEEGGATVTRKTKPYKVQMRLRDWISRQLDDVEAAAEDLLAALRKSFKATTDATTEYTYSADSIVEALDSKLHNLGLPIITVEKQRRRNAARRAELDGREG